jgi:putative protease
VLSEGTTHLDCGRPCEKHELSLIDHKGLEHPVIVDAACRNTVFNGEAHSAGWMIPELREMGVHRFRIEFVRESQSETARALEAWQSLLRGERDSESLAHATGTREQFGVAEGGMVIAPMDV